jgi:hypothetical protein
LPQLVHDHSGMASITSKAEPLPKLRVTCFNCKDALPQCAQWCSAEVDSDDKECACKAELDDGFGRRTVERDTGDDALDFAGFGVALTFNDLPREDNVFEVEDCEVVIFKLLSRMG